MVREENKYIERYVKRYAYLHEITLDIDSEYFITQIEKKLIQDNLNYLTNVKGKMTAWRAFKNDSNFQKVCKEGLIHLKERLNFGKVEITKAIAQNHTIIVQHYVQEFYTLIITIKHSYFPI